MPKLAANISHLFPERSFPTRFQAAKDAGFEGVEILFPYEIPAQQIRDALDGAGLKLALINAPPLSVAPDHPALPGGEEGFRAAMEAVLDYAAPLAPDAIHVMSGYTQGIEAEDALVDNLLWLADLAPDQLFTIEPLNLGDQPGYFLSDYDIAARVLNRVDRPNLGLQYDSYHSQKIHGDALAVWEKFRPLVRHVQLGAPPERTEPRLDQGPIYFPSLFAAIASSGYDGWISAEYRPTTAKTEDSLGWMSGFGA
ncbi:hydroxypyruvate isomerase family protein [Pseudodonghicola xiamenensis]|uniref:Hydroxypyruvate isomerase n=1 Tax=Pseudodonghicola xiamenensis TaxID=337702 RepID=A0A8J3HBJ8_9RHOB|nr:TIM barrel protein [Pseudodonghicola xiamenensis]GHH04723.1 hydroxypyruvate isomerase [Pseudodonghicola xiamenensis]